MGHCRRLPLSQFFQAVNANNVPGDVATSYVANVGTAVPVGNILNVLGSGGVTVTGAGSTLTISSGGGGFNWIDQGISITGAADTGYFTTAAITITLPAFATQGQGIAFIVDNAGALTIQAAAGQTIRIANNTSTVGGTATNTQRGDALWLVYRAADTTWISFNGNGGWNLA